MLLCEEAGSAAGLGADDLLSVAASDGVSTVVFLRGCPLLGLSASRASSLRYAIYNPPML